MILLVEFAVKQKEQQEEDEEEKGGGGGWREEGCISYYAIARTVVEFTAAAVEVGNGSSDFIFIIVVVVVALCNLLVEVDLVIVRTLETGSGRADGPSVMFLA